MVVGFKTTYAIGAYHYWCSRFDSRSGRGVQHYVIKFVSGFFPGPLVSSANKTDSHDTGLTLQGDSGEEVALWLLTSLCTSAKREVEVAL